MSYLRSIALSRMMSGGVMSNSRPPVVTARTKGGEAAVVGAAAEMISEFSFGEINYEFRNSFD